MESSRRPCGPLLFQSPWYNTRTQGSPLCQCSWYNSRPQGSPLLPSGEFVPCATPLGIPWNWAAICLESLGISRLSAGIDVATLVWYNTRPPRILSASRLRSGAIIVPSSIQSVCVSIPSRLSVRIDVATLVWYNTRPPRILSASRLCSGAIIVPSGIQSACILIPSRLSVRIDVTTIVW